MTLHTRAHRQSLPKTSTFLSCNKVPGSEEAVGQLSVASLKFDDAGRKKIVDKHNRGTAVVYFAWQSRGGPSSWHFTRLVHVHFDFKTGSCI